MNRHAVYYLKRKSGSNRHHLSHHAFHYVSVSLCFTLCLICLIICLIVPNYISHYVSLPYVMPFTLCFIVSHLTHDLSHNILLCLEVVSHFSSCLIRSHRFPHVFFPHVPDSSRLMSLIITCLKRFNELQYMSRMLHHISHQVSSCLIVWLNI